MRALSLSSFVLLCVCGSRAYPVDPAGPGLPLIAAAEAAAPAAPEFYIFDGDLRLAYRGQLDNARPKNGLPVTGSDLRTALDAILEKRPVYPIQRPGGGCNIKWKV